jgi:ComF family protein
LPPGLRVCGRCRRGISPLAAGVSLGPFEGSLRTLVHELKYHGRRRVASRLAEELLAAPGVRLLLSDDAILVPVPLHPRRRRERGFNQSELLARELSRRTGLAVIEGALVRRQDSPPQTGLSAAARRRNVASAFAVRRKPAVVGHRIILIDDVWTTGATALACARMLREAGAAEVRLLAVARAA